MINISFQDSNELAQKVHDVLNFFMGMLESLFSKVCFFGKFALVACDFALPQKTACLQFLT